MCKKTAGFSFKNSCAAGIDTTIGFNVLFLTDLTALKTARLMGKYTYFHCLCIFNFDALHIHINVIALQNNSWFQNYNPLALQK